MNAVVRVGSSGDNGSVSQQNSADSSGGSSDVAPVSATSNDSGATGATDQTLPTTGEADGLNQSDTTQTIDQQQGGAPTDPSEQVTLNGGSGDPSLGSTSATTTQTGAKNVNVSVRVGSPGSDGTVTQKNTATANGSSPQLSIVNTDGGTNTNVAIVIPGDVSAPGSNWQWNWKWDGTWAPDPNASASDLAPTSSAAWNWIWSNTQTGANTNANTGSGADGTFSWTWVLTLADGSTVTNSWQWACSCNWSWTWSWDFSKPPASITTTPADASSSAPDPQPTETYDTGAVTQENSVAANAYAGTGLQTAQTLDQQPGLDPRNALAVRDSSQLAMARATASSNHTWNKNFAHGVGTSSVVQSNTLEADAMAVDTFQSAQVTVQRQTSSPTTTQSQTSTEWVGNDQTANAEAVASATDTGNTNVAWAPFANSAFVGAVIQHNDATSSAFSYNDGAATQWTQQFQNAGTATTQDEQAYNLLWNVQNALSVSVASQGGVVNLNHLLVPAGSRATNPSITQRNLVSSQANSVNVASTWQTISQTQNGLFASEAAFALNQASTDQTTVETMTSYQANDVHRAGWLGVEPPLPPGNGAGGGGGGGGGSFAAAGGYGSAIVWTYRAGLTSGGGLHSRAAKTTGHATSWCSSAGCHGPAGGGDAPFLPPSTGSPGTGSPAYGETVDAGSASGHATLGATGDAGSGSGSGSSAPLGISIAAAGAAGSAPGTGSGLVVAANDPYTLAAPANLGPRTSASALGPPMVVLDPFERPG